MSKERLEAGQSEQGQLSGETGEAGCSPNTPLEGRHSLGRLSSALEVFSVSFKLGITSFGGPTAHLGYFHEEYVKRRGWLGERSYADLVALCQFLPGPASSQVGIGIGLIRAGWIGGLAAWLGFTLPSAAVMVLFALWAQGKGLEQAGWLHGLKLVAVAVVAQAVIGMGRKLAADRWRASFAAAALAAALLWPYAWTQPAVIAAAAFIGMFMFQRKEEADDDPLPSPVGRGAAYASLTLFGALLIVLPVLREAFPGANALAAFDGFYRSGALVFGGGHVVLPLLERETVPQGLVSPEQFLAGYAAAQAVPGPLFTFAAYLGAVFGGIGGAALATAAIFLPAYLLVVGALPLWSALRRSPKAQGALSGANAAVVGILLAALYQPIWTTTVTGPRDVAAAAVLFVLLVFWKQPPWLVVLIGAAIGAVFFG